MRSIDFRELIIVIILWTLLLALCTWLVVSTLRTTKSDLPLPPVELVMTETEARLTRQAIELVQDDVEAERLRSADLTLRALSAELPKRVQELVLQALGTPDMDSMLEALEEIKRRIYPPPSEQQITPPIEQDIQPAPPIKRERRRIGDRIRNRIERSRL